MSQNLNWTSAQAAAYQARRGMVAREPAEADEARAMKKLRVVRPIEQACQGGEREVWPKQNRWEMDFFRYLQINLPGATIMAQALTFRLARATSYTPDVVVWHVGDGRRPEVFEVKGLWRQSGRIKLKMAARLFPQFVFNAATRPDGKKGGWKIEQISA